MRKKSKGRRKRRRKYSQLDDITKLTVDVSKMVVATSAGLALMKGAKEALRR